MDWSPGGWRGFEARQQPDYPDSSSLDAVERELAARPPLVGLPAVDALTAALAEAQAGRAFLLQGGDCAEAFDEDQARTVALLRAMADSIRRALPVIAVGRVAGQYAKPRSEPTESRDGIALPAWRGDLVNGRAFEAAARRADPRRMLLAYDRAAATLARLPVFASHEALLLAWEQALVRSQNGRRYASSGHLLWIGERTLFEGSAHVEFARAIANPLGLKCGPRLASDTLLRLLDTLNPDRRAGRITLIVRLGSDRVAEALPPLIRALARAGHPVLWTGDPMHGNTRRGAGGRKIRLMADIEAETRAFFALAEAEGAFPGGIHVEMTGADVLECGPAGAPDAACDPRLNPAQAMRLTDLVADMLTERRAPLRRAVG